MRRGGVTASLVGGFFAFVVFASVHGVDGLLVDTQHHDSGEFSLGIGAQDDFDYFVFSQQWPGTYCTSSGTCCDAVAQPVTFTVHGLWPENNDGTWPECCSGPGFDQAKVQELTDLLQEYWPTLSCSSPQQCSGKKTGSFWQHEWEKHGTCGYPIIPDEATYFSVGLNLRLKYDITKILNAAGFAPSSSKQYQTSEVFAAIQKGVGAKPIMTCKSKMINEVWVCFTKDLKVRDCGSSSNSCAQTIQILPLNQKTNDKHTFGLLNWV